MIEVQSLSGTEESNVSVHDSLMAVDPLQKMDVFFLKKRCMVCSPVCQNTLKVGLLTADSQKRYKTVKCQC